MNPGRLFFRMLRRGLARLGSGRAEGMQVLSYHSADDSGSPLSVSPSRLGEHLRALKEDGWRGLRIGEYLDRLRGTAAPGREILITFDDGYRNFHECAAPVLAALGFPATLFMVTGLAGGRADWYERDSRLILGAMMRSGFSAGERARLRSAMSLLSKAPLLGWEELRELSREGFDVCSHGSTHRFLPPLSAEALREELRRSKSDLEDRLGISPKAIAYPYNVTDQRVAEAAAEAGYLAGFVGDEYTSRGDDFRIRRTGLYEGYDTADLRFFLSPARRRYARLQDGARAWIARFNDLRRDRE